MLMRVNFSAEPLALLHDQPRGRHGRLHGCHLEQLPPAGVVILGTDLPGGIAGEHLIAQLLVEVMNAADDLLVELADAVEVHAGLARDVAEGPGVGPFPGDHPGGLVGRLAWSFDLQEGLDRVLRERLEVDLEVVLPVGEVGGVLRDESLGCEVRLAADRIEDVGGERQVEHLLDGDHAEDVGRVRVSLGMD
ncbi:hypothetical protein SAMN05444166_5476 [Singulisphaera sp. GP187]|nr:hypothetical protein SAMN05444166_5476 [Singulisphaera sp. GP187]